MVRFSFQDGMDAVNLLKKHHQGELVLESEGAEGDDVIGSRPHFRGMAIGPSNENRDPLHPVELPAPDP